jgi:uncharacterized membrane-anchored protein
MQQDACQHPCRGADFTSKLPACVLLLFACACHPGAPASSVPVISADARRGPEPVPEVQVARQVVTPESATSIRELYLDAEREEKRGAIAEARSKYRRIVDLDPDSEWGVAALRGFALCSEALLDYVAAARAFETLAERHRASEWARSALLGAVRLRVFLEEWERGATLADSFLERYADASDREQLVLHGAHALFAVARGEEERATLLGASPDRGTRLGPSGSGPA